MAAFRISVGMLVALLLIAATGASATGGAPALRVRPDCSPAGLVTQSMDGRISGCLRLGNVDPGRHEIALQGLLPFAAPQSIKRGLPPVPRPPEPAVALTLSPTAGGPGTVVTITGHLTTPFRLRDSHPNVCWDGCENGLGYGDIPMRWTSPRTFHTKIVVPAAPWLEGGPNRVAQLVSGDYRVGIQCIRSAQGCGAVTEGTAMFHLHVARPVPWCLTQATCAQVRVTPQRALPGAVVRVSGFAPLAEGEMGSTGSGYEPVVLRRSRAPAIRFSARNGLVTVGSGRVEVAGPPEYTATAPLAQVSDGVSQISADPASPTTVAWCAGQTIAVSGPDGTSSIPTAAAKSTLKAMGFSLRFEPQPPCAGVAPLATSTGAPAGLAVAFSVTEAAGAPPFYLAALVTRDDGKSWAPIPVPDGSSSAGFGGFRYEGSTLEVVFGASLKGAPRDYPEFSLTRAVTEVSSADAQSWRQAPLGCPPAGPCVTFGPYQPGNCAMNGTMQTLLRSTDSGSRWSSLDFPYPAQSCGEAELVATSRTSELLIDSTSTYPVLRTSDGGATWHDVALPRRGGNGDLTVLPDGSLVMADGLGYSGPWKLLGPGARAWCELRVPTATGEHHFQVAPPTVIGGQLWWLTGSLDSSTAAPALQDLPLSALNC